MIPLEVLKDDYNWKQAFQEMGKADNPETREAARYKIEDIEEILAEKTLNGDFAECELWGLFRMKDGMYLYIHAGCDTTGWECQSTSFGEYHANRDQLIALMSDESRFHLGLGG